MQGFEFSDPHSPFGSYIPVDTSASPVLTATGFVKGERAIFDPL